MLFPTKISNGVQGQRPWQQKTVLRAFLSLQTDNMSDTVVVLSGCDDMIDKVAGARSYRLAIAEMMRLAMQSNPIQAEKR